MARLARLVLAGCAHLVLHRAHSGQPVFIDAVDADNYLQSLQRFGREQRVRVHAYGLLDNEVRLLLTPSADDGVARLMQSVARAYAAHHNRMRSRSGSPWEGRFRSAPVEAGRWALQALWHAEAHGESRSSAARVLLSTASHHRGEQVDSVVSEAAEYWAFGNTPFERQDAYRRWTQTHDAPDDEARLRTAVLRGWPVGSTDFLADIERRLGRPSTPRERGRPRRIAAD